jgi:hypothetical protein
MQIEITLIFIELMPDILFILMCYFIQKKKEKTKSKKFPFFQHYLFTLQFDFKFVIERIFLQSLLYSALLSLLYTILSFGILYIFSLGIDRD